MADYFCCPETKYLYYAKTKTQSEQEIMKSIFIMPNTYMKYLLSTILQREKKQTNKQKDQ